MGEIAEHCQGVKIVLVALKCDLREEVEEKDDDRATTPTPKSVLHYQQGYEVAKRIGALRYLGMPQAASGGVTGYGTCSMADP